jgi:hypothetical protein
MNFKLRHYRLFTALCTETYLGFPECLSLTETLPNNQANKPRVLVRGLRFFA